MSAGQLDPHGPSRASPGLPEVAIATRARVVRLSSPASEGRAEAGCSCPVLASALARIVSLAVAQRLGPNLLGLRVADPSRMGRRSTLIRGVRSRGVLILAGAVGAAGVALTPAAVLAAPPGGPATHSTPAGSVSAGGVAGPSTTSSFTCSIGGTLSTIQPVANVAPDPVLGAGATPFLGEPTIATTPSNLPAGVLGITAPGATTGTVSSPAATFAAGFADETELYEVPNTASAGTAPAGSPGAFDSSQGAPLNALPSGTITVAGATYSGPGLPYAQVFPLLNGTPNFTDPLIPGGIPTSVYYQSYSNNPSAWMPGGEQPPSLCGGSHEYTVITFDTAPYVGRELTAGQPYGAYLLLRDTDTSGPLSNHLWYFQAAAPPPPQPTVAVTVTNDAAGQGVYQQTETAPAAGESVPFQVTVTNTSSVEETIGTVTEGYGGPSTQVCQENLGHILSPGGSVACEFTLSAFSPPAGETLTDTVTVSVGQSGVPSTSGRGQGWSSVTTADAPGPPSPSVVVDTTNDAAGTGYSKVEEARVAGAAVPFQVTIQNSSAVIEQISSISISYGNTTEPVCSSDVGLQLTAATSVTCRFLLSDFAPPAGHSLVGVVTVVVAEQGDPADSATGFSGSTVTTSPTPVALAVSVANSNDAAGQGVYLKTEIAQRPGGGVPFRVAIRNDGSGAEVITAISSRSGRGSLNECQPMVGLSLSVGQTVHCNFTIPAYAPAAGQSRIDTATVDVSQPGNPANTASGAGSSTVTTAAPVLSVMTAVSSTTAVLGQTLTYTIRVTNTGAAPAQDVLVKDVLSGTAGFTVNDGTGGTADSFAGRPVEPVTKTAVGAYQWHYRAMAAGGGTAVVVFTVTIRGSASASVTARGKVALTDTVSVVAVGCTTSSCRSVSTTYVAVLAGSVKAASVTAPGAPATGAHLDLTLATLLVVLGLAMLGTAVASHGRVWPRPQAASLSTSQQQTARAFHDFPRCPVPAGLPTPAEGTGGTRWRTS